jgi:NAD(P)-dependent dehydrogenase (short-subunit alcohol dehydrogenase family)
VILNERTAIVTGSGGTGCGRAIARHLALEGARVVVTDTNIAGGEETVRLIRSEGGRATFCRADVRNEEDVRNLIAFAASEFGPLSVLVNNASAFYGHGYEMDHWLATAETEFLGPLFTIRCAIETMRQAKTDGTIVNISSISALWHGRRVAGGAPMYDAAKAGLLRLTTGLAELAKTDHIRVNCLAPGWIATEGPLEYWESLTPEQRLERGVPARLLTTSQIADVVVRLATDESLAGRVVIWWSDDEPRLIEWGDPGYRKWSPF